MTCPAEGPRDAAPATACPGPSSECPRPSQRRRAACCRIEDSNWNAGSRLSLDLFVLDARNRNFRDNLPHGSLSALPLYGPMGRPASNAVTRHATGAGLVGICADSRGSQSFRARLFFDRRPPSLVDWGWLEGRGADGRQAIATNSPFATGCGKGGAHYHSACCAWTGLGFGR
jgi:hypothetical protein